jgi:hypothetical protein
MSPALKDGLENSSATADAASSMIARLAHSAAVSARNWVACATSSCNSMGTDSVSPPSCGDGFGRSAPPFSARASRCRWPLGPGLRKLSQGDM